MERSDFLNFRSLFRVAITIVTVLLCDHLLTQATPPVEVDKVKMAEDKIKPKRHYFPLPSCFRQASRR